MMLNIARGVFTKCTNFHKQNIYRPIKTLYMQSKNCILLENNLRISKVSSYLWQQRRGSKFGVYSNNIDEKVNDNLRGFDRNLATDAAWAVRLANENGYLSWCRNAYLCTTVGVIMSSEVTKSFTAQYAASGAFMVGLLNLMAGTLCYTVHLLRLRHTVNMSRFAMFLYISFAVIHLCAWGVVIILCFGYPDDDLTIINMEVNDVGEQNQA